MKKYILILIFLPLFCNSQTLIKDVSTIAFLNKKTDYHTSKKVDSNMSIYVDEEKWKLYIKDDVKTITYEIDGINYYSDDDVNFETEYIIKKDGELQTALVYYYKSSKAFLIKSKDENKVEFYYERQ